MKLINQNVEEWHCGYTLPEIWSHIAKCARGQFKTAGGYIWKYADEVDDIKST